MKPTSLFFMKTFITDKVERKDFVKRVRKGKK